MKLMMRSAIFLAASVVSMNGLAKQVVGVSPSSRAQLDVYAAPKTTELDRQVAVDTVEFPLDILETDSGFHKVNIQGEAGWLRGVQLRTRKPNTAECINPRGRTNSAPGVSSGCE